MYLLLWLISRWRLPATPCLSLPVAVSLKRFLTPLLVFILGIFVSLLPAQIALGATFSNCHGSPNWPGRSFFQQSGKTGAYKGSRPRWQGGVGWTLNSRSPRAA